jgi:hypothetical protein
MRALLLRCKLKELQTPPFLIGLVGQAAVQCRDIALSPRYVHWPTIPSWVTDDPCISGVNESVSSAVQPWMILILAVMAVMVAGCGRIMIADVEAVPVGDVRPEAPTVATPDAGLEPVTDSDAASIIAATEAPGTPEEAEEEPAPEQEQEQEQEQEPAPVPEQEPGPAPDPQPEPVDAGGGGDPVPPADTRPCVEYVKVPASPSWAVRVHISGTSMPYYCPDVPTAVSCGYAIKNVNSVRDDKVYPAQGACHMPVPAKCLPCTGGVTEW